VRERLAALAESGATTLNVTPLAGTREERVALVERVRHLAPPARETAVRFRNAVRR